mmetsp:Transcript_74980/g.181250  ORF Transcript_74980/g.181250 Transcript_74980/m.181250 type:complete len:213 (+) Transcript_74980:62-700(+)
MRLLLVILPGIVLGVAAHVALTQLLVALDTTLDVFERLAPRKIDQVAMTPHLLHRARELVVVDVAVAVGVGCLTQLANVHVGDRQVEVAYRGDDLIVRERAAVVGVDAAEGGQCRPELVVDLRLERVARSLQLLLAPARRVGSGRGAHATDVHIWRAGGLLQLGPQPGASHRGGAMHVAGQPPVDRPVGFPPQVGLERTREVRAQLEAGLAR